jgi:hypothetical protein
MHPRSLRASQAVVATIGRGWGAAARRGGEAAAAATVRCTKRDFIVFRFKPVHLKQIQGCQSCLKIRKIERHAINFTQNWIVDLQFCGFGFFTLLTSMDLCFNIQLLLT